MPNLRPVFKFQVERLAMKISSLFSRVRSNPPERAIYAQIVALARQPWLYQNAGVADTVTGRFDMITLHSFIVIERLSNAGETGADLAQKLFDQIFEDMDHNLREMGVGDLSVGKKVRKMSEIFYGACSGYRAALDAQKDDISQNLSAALRRNITGDDADQHKLDNLVDYTIALRNHVETLEIKSILAGELDADRFLNR